MGSLIVVAGALWVAVIMWDAFEALVLPRRVTRRLRPTRMFYRVTWEVWSAVAPHASRRPPGDLPQLLRTVIAAGVDGRVGGQSRRGVRAAPDRERPQRPRRRLLHRP